MNRRAEGREGCVRACFCAARSYNRGEPQGAANSPRLSNRFGGLASCYGSLSLRIGSRSIIAVKNPSKLEANSRIAAIKAKTVMASISGHRSGFRQSAPYDQARARAQRISVKQHI